MEKLEIRHFKAFGSLLTISPTAAKKNVLLYGENGSGKSSVYEAIRLTYYRDRLLQSVISVGAEAAQMHAETEHYYGTYAHKRAPGTAVPDIDIKVNNTDFKVFPSADYNCFMLSDADLQYVTQEVEGGVVKAYCKINLKEVIKKPFFPQFDFDHLCANETGNIVNAVNDALEHSFYEDLRIGKENDDYDIYLKVDSQHLRESSGINKIFNEARLRLVVLLILLNVAQKIDVASPKGHKLLIFDDIVNSLDASNRKFLIQYVLSKFDQYQIIWMSHNIGFCNFMEDVIKHTDSVDNWLLYNLYLTNRGPQIYEYNDLDSVDSIRDDFNAGMLPLYAVGNVIRQRFEADLHEFCKIVHAGKIELPNTIITSILETTKPWYIYKDGTKLKDCNSLMKYVNDTISSALSDVDKLSNIQAEIAKYNSNMDLQKLLIVLQEFSDIERQYLHSLSHTSTSSLPAFNQKETYACLDMLDTFEKSLKSLKNGLIL